MLSSLTNHQEKQISKTLICPNLRCNLRKSARNIRENLRENNLQTYYYLKNLFPHSPEFDNFTV
jgi:hypothetical protein